MRRGIRKVLVRVALFGGLWLVLAGTNPKSWGLSLAIIGLATATSLRLVPELGALRVMATMRFIALFLQSSLRGGIDVASRAFRPVSPLDPGLADFQTRLRTPGTRLFFAAVIGLLPGTVGATLREDRLRIHVLDRRSEFEPLLRSLEERIADATGTQLRPLDGGPRDP
jgi:multicomponent Na+:H+ antiporter subunit E